MGCNSRFFSDWTYEDKAEESWHGEAIGAEDTRLVETAPANTTLIIVLQCENKCFSYLEPNHKLFVGLLSDSLEDLFRIIVTTGTGQVIFLSIFQNILRYNKITVQTVCFYSYFNWVFARYWTHLISEKTSKNRKEKTTNKKSAKRWWGKCQKNCRQNPPMC